MTELFTKGRRSLGRSASDCPALKLAVQYKVSHKTAKDLQFASKAKAKAVVYTTISKASSSSGSKNTFPKAKAQTVQTTSVVGDTSAAVAATTVPEDVVKDDVPSEPDDDK